MGVRTPAPPRLPKHVPTKNAPDFTFPNRDTPKTRPVLGLNLRRSYLRVVCFCAPTRIYEKSARFHISAHGYVKNAPDFILPNRDTPKTHPILGLNLRRGYLRGVCNTPLHGYMKSPAGFRPKPSAMLFQGRMLLRPTRVHEKFGGFHIPARDMARNPAGFGPCHST